MWEDLAFAEAFEVDASHEPAPGQTVTGMIEDLMIDVEGRLRIGGQNPFGLPVAEKPCGPRVAVVSIIVAGLVAIKDQPHDIGRMPLVSWSCSSGPITS